MATRIKLKRLGKMRQPQYRIVVADSRTKRDGRSIEEIGIYQPKDDPSFIRVDSERAQYWLGVGAQPTEAVQAIFKVTGDWQKFKGLPAPEPMKVAEPKPARPEIGAVFAASDKAAEGAATTPKKKGGKKADDTKADAAKAEPAKGEAKADAAKSEPAKAESADAAKTEDSAAAGS